MQGLCREQFTLPMLSSYIVSHYAKIILAEYPTVIWGKKEHE